MDFLTRISSRPARQMNIIIDEVTPEMAVKIDGKLISCNNNDLLELYNVDGTKVASGRGCVAAPTSGIYILNVSGKALKIAIK